MLQNHIATGSQDNGRFLSSSSDFEFEDPVPVNTDGDNDNDDDDDAECMFSCGLFSQDKCGERGVQCTQCKSGLTVTALGTHRMLISFVPRALMVKNM
jgi:hypothetical protein